MHFFPGEPWDSWWDKPYDLVLQCIDLIDAKLRGGEPED